MYEHADFALKVLNGMIENVINGVPLPEIRDPGLMPRLMQGVRELEALLENARLREDDGK